MNENEIARVGRELAVEVKGAFHDANLWTSNANKLARLANSLRDRGAPLQNESASNGGAVAVLLMALAAEIDPAHPDDPSEDQGYGERKTKSDRRRDPQEDNDQDRPADDPAEFDDSEPWEF